MQKQGLSISKPEWFIIQALLRRVLQKLCLLWPFSSSYLKRDWPAGPHQSFFWYDTNYRFVICSLHLKGLVTFTYYNVLYMFSAQKKKKKKKEKKLSGPKPNPKLFETNVQWCKKCLPPLIGKNFFLWYNNCKELQKHIFSACNSLIHYQSTFCI